MTREEALQILDTIPTIGEQVDALEMAIEALEQEPCEDAISREAAHDFMRSLRKWYVRSEDGKFNNVGLLYDDVMFGLDRLPSVTPKVAECEDCISRADTIEWLKNVTVTDGITFETGFKQILTDIQNMPSVIPKQNWIPVNERLPEPFSFVNCTCHSLIDDREDWVVETCYLPQPPNSPYSDWGNIPMLNWRECEVIAWMYRDIPEPYKSKNPTGSNCTACILDGTDACSRGAGRAVDGRVCEDFVGESED